MPTHTEFRAISSIGDSLLNDQLEHNMVSFYDWASLQIGGYFNVTIPTSGVYGGNQHRLRQVNDPYYADGRVWEGFRNNWVWETGISYSPPPISISGVYVNGNFQPSTGIGTYAFKIDYPRGRVIFDSAISTTSVVTAEFSHKLIKWDTADQPEFRQIMFESFRVDYGDFFQAASGLWGVLSSNRVQLPAVYVESVPRRSYKGIQLGGGKYIYQDLMFTIYAEDNFWRKQIVDLITNTVERTLILYDRNSWIAATGYPLNYDGTIRSGATTYPHWVGSVSDGGFAWRNCVIKDATVEQNITAAPLFGAKVRLNAEIRLPEL